MQISYFSLNFHSLILASLSCQEQSLLRCANSDFPCFSFTNWNCFVERIRMFSPTDLFRFIQSFLYISVGLWIFALFFGLKFNTTIIYCSSNKIVLALAIQRSWRSCCVPSSFLLKKFLSASLLSFTTRFPRPSCIFPAQP